MELMDITFLNEGRIYSAPKCYKFVLIVAKNFWKEHLARSYPILPKGAEPEDIVVGQGEMLGSIEWWVLLGSSDTRKNVRQVNDTPMEFGYEFQKGWHNQRIRTQCIRDALPKKKTVNCTQIFIIENMAMFEKPFPKRSLLPVWASVLSATSHLERRNASLLCIKDTPFQHGEIIQRTKAAHINHAAGYTDGIKALRVFRRF